MYGGRYDHLSTQQKKERSLAVYGAAVFIIAVLIAVFVRNYVKIDFDSYSIPCPHDMSFLGSLGMPAHAHPEEREKCLASNIRSNIDFITNQAWLRIAIFYGSFIVFIIILFGTLGGMSRAKAFRTDTGFGCIHVVTFCIAGFMIISFILGILSIYDLFVIWGYKE